MADEPQFHMTVVTQKRRKVDREELLRGDRKAGASGDGTQAGAQGAAKASAGEASGVLAAEGQAAEAARDGSRESAAVLNDGAGAVGEAARAASTEAAAGQAASQQGKAGRAEGAGAGQSGSASGGSGSRQRSSRRRYKDYGTVDLGSLRDSIEEERDFTDDPNGPTPTQGELQRQFYRKYDAILNRRYFNRNKNKVTRIVVIALIVALVVVIALFTLSSIAGGEAETLEPPEVSTIPMETIDLG